MDGLRASPFPRFPPMTTHFHTVRTLHTQPSYLLVPVGRHPGHCLLVAVPSAHHTTPHHTTQLHTTPHTTHHITPDHTTPFHITPHHSTPRRTTLQNLHDTTRHDTTRHYTTIHYNTLHPAYSTYKSLRMSCGGCCMLGYLEHRHKTHSVTHILPQNVRHVGATGVYAATRASTAISPATPRPGISMALALCQQSLVVPCPLGPQAHLTRR